MPLSVADFKFTTIADSNPRSIGEKGIPIANLRQIGTENFERVDASVSMRARELSIDNVLSKQTEHHKNDLEKAIGGHRSVETALRAQLEICKDDNVRSELQANISNMRAGISAFSITLENLLSPVNKPRGSLS